MIVEVNGKQYEEREKPKIPKLSPIMIATLAISGGWPGMGGEEWDAQELAEEFALIQNKKSRLSANRRRTIEWQFHQRFREIKETKNLNDF